MLARLLNEVKPTASRQAAKAAASRERRRTIINAPRLSTDAGSRSSTARRLIGALFFENEVDYRQRSRFTRWPPPRNGLVRRLAAPRRPVVSPIQADCRCAVCRPGRALDHDAVAPRRIDPPRCGRRRGPGAGMAALLSDPSAVFRLADRPRLDARRISLRGGRCDRLHLGVRRLRRRRGSGRQGRSTGQRPRHPAHRSSLLPTRPMCRSASTTISG